MYQYDEALLSKHYEKLEEMVGKNFVPDHGTEYYHLGETPCFVESVLRATFNYMDPACFRDLEIGNYFETFEELQEAIERLKVAAELRRLSAESGELDNPWDGDISHFFLTYDFSVGRLIVDFVWDECHNDIYFSSREAAKNAAEKIGTERLIKYWFGIPYVLEVKEGGSNG